MGNKVLDGVERAREVFADAKAKGTSEVSILGLYTTPVPRCKRQSWLGGIGG